MTQIVASMSMSLDGFVAGPRDTRDQPLGEGGERLHAWLSAQRTPRDTDVLTRLRRSVGAVVMGRRSYDLCAHGAWDGGGPFGRTPCFVLTHRVPAPEEVRSAPGLFHFVTDGFATAVEEAARAAGDRDVAVYSPSCVQQALADDLLDVLHLHLAPVLLGGGVPLFARAGHGRPALERTDVVATPAATHLRFRVVRAERG